MNLIDSFINGMVAGLGMVIMTTIFGFLTFRFAKNWITTMIAEIWAKIKKEGIRLDGLQIDGRLKTKKTPVICVICGKCCKNRAGLSGHMQFKHPEYALQLKKINQGGD